MDDLGVPLFLSRLKFSQKWLKKQSHYIKFSSGLRIIREDGSFFTIAVWPRARVNIISTWRIIPFSKWLITMVSKSPK